MSDLHIQRTHELGREKAQSIIDGWIASAEQEYRMSCDMVRTDDKDVVRFKRSGVQGEVVATANSFEITATLGFLFRSFLPKIEERINKNLDDILK